MGEEQAPERRQAVAVEAELDARQAEGERGPAGLVEHRGAQAPRSLDDEPGVHGVAAIARFAHAPAQCVRIVG